MSEMKYTILESWPYIKDDLLGFLSDTDAWIIAELKNARSDKDWDRLDRIIAVMDMVHGMSHSH